MSEAHTSPRRSSEKYREYRLRAAAKHPEKVRARWQTQDAIKRGVLVRQPCEQCGQAKSQAHHDDYSKPLAVRWLCHPCHVELHRGIKRDGISYCKRGHELTGHNVRISNSRWGQNRACRQCHTEATWKRRGKL